MRGRGVTEDRAKTLVEAAHNSVGLNGKIETKSELYMLLEESSDYGLRSWKPSKKYLRK